MNSTQSTPACPQSTPAIFSLTYCQIKYGKTEFTFIKEVNRRVDTEGPLGWPEPSWLHRLGTGGRENCFVHIFENLMYIILFLESILNLLFSWKRMLYLIYNNITVCRQDLEWHFVGTETHLCIHSLGASLCAGN